MKRFLPFSTLVLMLSLAACGGGGETGAANNNGDKSPPTLSINGPTANPTYTTGNANITISGSVSDNEGITELYWQNDRGGNGTINIAPNWSYSGVALQSGVNNITVVAKDAATNEARQTLEVTYQVNDTQNPSITITSPNNTGSFNTDLSRISIAGTSGDNYGVSEVRWQSDTGSGTAIGTNPWIVNDILLNTGSNTIRVTAYDNSGNTSQATMTVDYATVTAAETCMTCHNGSAQNDYTGNGLTNPHPFAGAQNIRCTVCHGGNGQGQGKDGSHVPVPPQIGGDQNLINDPVAYFNRLTLTGLDKLPNYQGPDGTTYTALDYLQFVNPGDLRVVSQNRSCGVCHGNRHVDWVMRSPIATETGILGGALAAAGVENAISAHRGKYFNTASDYGFRAVTNPNFDSNLLNNNLNIGALGQLIEFPEYAQMFQTGRLYIYNNLNYDSDNLPNDLYTAAELNGQKTNAIKADSNLATLYAEQIAFTCGDCHLGSAGANNRFGDFRSSGCTACHMAYSPDGRSRSTDPNVNKQEPVNPDAIQAPERPHIATHRIQNVAKTLPNGEFVTGIQDQACAGCHQGSNRTVMQFWGIRLDQNQDLVNNTQYPANPARFVNTATDPRLFDPSVNNNTFNGRNANQYIAFEDYDNDGRDDTPPDIHHEAGLGCIDCHGSRDLHGGANDDASGGQIMSREEQSVKITCEVCHGTVDEYAKTVSCLTYDDEQRQCAVDKAGNPLRHVIREDATGNYVLKSRLDGRLHYISQTRDTIIQSNKSNPFNRQLVYNAKASYSMGRADGNALTGIGPMQNNPNTIGVGFSHSDTMDCVSCHASWTNSCIGCHLAGAYDANPTNFRLSNITGERIVYNQANADFVYQTPVPFQLGVSYDNKITQMTPAEKVFYRYTDINGTTSQVFAFTDRNGNGNNPNIGGRNALPALGQNVMMAHSIRGKVSNANEGPRYCVACHLNTASLAQFGAQYDTFRAAIANNNFAQLDFNLLQQHIGQNTGNQLNSPIWVHMVAGLGTGLFLFDQNGCPVNPLDNNAARQNCNNVAPANNFNVNNAVYNLDHIVEPTGISNAANNHPMRVNGPTKRGGSLDPQLSGPLGGPLIQRLTDPNNGIVLDSWLDANGNAQGNAANFIH